MQANHPGLTTARLAAAVLAGWMGSGVAVAQQAPDQSSAEFQSYRIPGWSFTPGMGLGVIHDSNVALSDPRADLGETQGDTLFNIVPSGQLEYLGRHTDFSASYRGFLRRYTAIDGLDGFSQRAAVGFRRAMSRRVTMFARNSFADAPTTDEVEVNGVPFRRTGTRTDTLAAGADIRLTKMATLGTRYDMTWVDFDRAEDALYLTGGWIHAIGADLGYRLSERLSLGGEYSFRAAEVNDGARHLAFQNAGGVLRIQLGPQTSGAVSAGLGVLHDRTAAETRRGPYVTLGVTHALEHATLGAAFERRYVPSFGFGGSSSSQDLRAYVLMPLGRQRMYVQGSGSWRRTAPFDVNALQLDTVWLRSTFGYAATRWARIEALYTYTRQDSVVTGGEVDRHRVGVQFVVSQPMRIQ